MPRVALVWYAMDQAWPAPDPVDTVTRFNKFTAWVGRTLKRKPERDA
jgi:hypothetical protein